MSTGNPTFNPTSPEEKKERGVEEIKKAIEKFLKGFELARINLHESLVSNDPVAQTALEEMTDASLLLEDIRNGTSNSSLWEKKL